jgi:hypothetical protein
VSATVLDRDTESLTERPEFRVQRIEVFPDVD